MYYYSNGVATARKRIRDCAYDIIPRVKYFFITIYNFALHQHAKVYNATFFVDKTMTPS